MHFNPKEPDAIDTPHHHKGQFQLYLRQPQRYQLPLSVVDELEMGWRREEQLQHRWVKPGAVSLSGGVWGREARGMLTPGKEKEKSPPGSIPPTSTPAITGSGTRQRENGEKGCFVSS